MNAAARALWNPIVAKEYRTRMRTWRSPLAITIYIVLLGGIGWAVFAAIAASSQSGFNPSPGGMGQQLFTFLVLFQVALLAFITPAITAGAISGERERQTLDLLFVTPVAPFSIIWGKLLASMSFIVLLLVISVPIFSLVFLFGGIELDQVVYAFLVTAVTAMTLGFVGVAFSTLFRRTLAATVASYGAAFVLLVGTLIYGLLFPTLVDPSGKVPPSAPAVTFISPAIPLFVIATNSPVTGYGYRYANPNGPPPGYLQSSGPSQYCFSTPNGVTNCTQSTGVATSTAIPSGLFGGWQYWQANIVMQLVISSVALALSAFLLPPVRRWRIRPARVVA
ncbi:MAG TPA: ABC transporter permease [Candidatus Limnocylindrales bacterium]|nr:ABC transporter permease [Candidatus Limnocylindrales bacterium]